MRPDWDRYFIQLAHTVATRGTCDRKRVGTVVVRDHQMLVAGYNGSVRGMAHCDDVGHLMEEDHCVRTVHSEANAIAQAAKEGVRLAGATLYVTCQPCRACAQLVANAGVVRIVYSEVYRDWGLLAWAGEAGVEVSRCTPISRGG